MLTRVRADDTHLRLTLVRVVGASWSRRAAHLARALGDLLLFVGTRPAARASVSPGWLSPRSRLRPPRSPYSSADAAFLFIIKS
jgi:hypothetical protein